jgi:hypothetical protein
MPRIKPAYKTQAAPKVVSLGSVSKPKKLAKWRPTTQPAQATPRVVNPWPKDNTGL